MKTKIFMGMLAAIMFTACSNDELTDVNRDGDEITFGVVTNLSTRAADVYCNNNKPTQFKVWAQFADGSDYIKGDVIASSDNKWNNESGIRYWPNNGTLNFFANVNGGDLVVTDNEAKIENYTIETVVANQKDILYAATLNQTKPTTEGSKVMMNFRHALSQVVFKAKNVNPNLYVVIDGVRVCHLSNNGSFTFNSSTAGNYEDHAGSGTNNYTTGSWSALLGDASYGVTFTQVSLTGNKNATAQSLTSDNPVNQEYNSNSMLLMPQTKGKWTTTATTGFYFAVKCAIYNVAGDSFDLTKDVALWGSSTETKYVVIPADIDWNPGRKYVYTFVFGEGNGGYKPDPDDPDPDPNNPDPNPNNPEPVLVPITFDVTVDDFKVVTPSDIEVDA